MPEQDRGRELHEVTCELRRLQGLVDVPITDEKAVEIEVGIGRVIRRLDALDIAAPAPEGEAGGGDITEPHLWSAAQMADQLLGRLRDVRDSGRGPTALYADLVMDAGHVRGQLLAHRCAPASPPAPEGEAGNDALATLIDEIGAEVGVAPGQPVLVLTQVRGWMEHARRTNAENERLRASPPAPVGDTELVRDVADAIEAAEDDDGGPLDMARAALRVARGSAVGETATEGGWRVLLARCKNYREDIDAPCTGEIEYRWGQAEAPCTTCGARCGVAVAAWSAVVVSPPAPAGPQARDEGETARPLTPTEALDLPAGSLIVAVGQDGHPAHGSRVCEVGRTPGCPRPDAGGYGYLLVRRGPAS